MQKSREAAEASRQQAAGRQSAPRQQHPYVVPHTTAQSPSKAAGFANGQPATDIALAEAGKGPGSPVDVWHVRGLRSIIEPRTEHLVQSERSLAGVPGTAPAPTPLQQDDRQHAATMKLIIGVSVGGGTVLIIALTIMACKLWERFWKNRNKPTVGLLFP
jgi:hypothetical protein